MNSTRVNRIYSKFEQLPKNKLLEIMNIILDQPMDNVPHETILYLLLINLAEMEAEGTLERYEETLIHLTNQG